MDAPGDLDGDPGDQSSGASRTAADMVNHSQTLKYDGKKGAAKELEADPKVKEAMEIAKKKTKKGQEKINAMYWSIQPPKGIIVEIGRAHV